MNFFFKLKIRKVTLGVRVLRRLCLSFNYSRTTCLNLGRGGIFVRLLEISKKNLRDSDYKYIIIITVFEKLDWLL